MPMLNSQRFRVFLFVVYTDDDWLQIVCFKDLIARQASNVIDTVPAHHEFRLCVFAVRHRARYHLF